MNRIAVRVFLFAGSQSSTPPRHFYVHSYLLLAAGNLRPCISLAAKTRGWYCDDINGHLLLVSFCFCFFAYFGHSVDDGGGKQISVGFFLCVAL